MAQMKSKTVDLGGVKLGPGRMPAICAPVLAYGVIEVRHQAEKLMESPADIAELRADYLQDEAYLNEYTVKKTLEALRKYLPGRPVIFTLRTKREGGEAQVDEEQYMAVCKGAVDTGLIDAIDIEYVHNKDNVGKLVGYANDHDVKVIMSSHDFRRTPDSAKIFDKMKQMEYRGADIAKTAVMPVENGDVFRVEQVCEQLKEELGIPFIMISMGPAGSISRFTGEQTGSVMTFGSKGLSSAPGQPDADDLDRTLRTIHMASRPAPRPPLEKPVNIVLGGFMGTGKTSTSKKIAAFTDFKPVEMDDLIVEKAGMSIPDIFKKHGEEYFREIEADVCREVSQRSGVVISTGGGTLLRGSNVETLKKNGTIVLLDSTPDMVYKRLSGSRVERPVLKGHMNRGYISWLMKQRQDAYDAAADITVDVSHLKPSETAVKILSLLKVIPS